MISTKVFKLTFAVVMVILLGRVSSYESSKRVRVTEGENVDLIFQYDFEPDADIQIRIGSRRPFYRSKEILEAGLSESQKERFNVHVEDNESYHMILVRVIISSVSREDEGTLICDMLKNGNVIEEHTRKIGISVDIPPGKASCRQENHHIDTSNKIWALIKCSAAVGSDHGIIECYQRGERMPPWARPVQNRTNLTQIIWMRKSSQIYCCASTVDKPKEICNCHDFIWDPVSLKEMKNQTDPCINFLNITSSIENQAKESTPAIDTEETRTKISEDTRDTTQVVCNNDNHSQLNIVRVNFILICLNTFFLVIIVGITVRQFQSKTTPGENISPIPCVKGKDSEYIIFDAKDRPISTSMTIRKRSSFPEGMDKT